MSYWRSPNCCELCQLALTGMAEIITVNEEKRSVLIVKQSRLIDWTFCPLCRSVVCRTSCLDPTSGYCRACASETEVNHVDFNERAAVAAADTGDDILSAETIF